MEIYFGGIGVVFVIGGILLGLGLIVALLGALIEEDMTFLRYPAVGIVALPVLAFLWPLALVGGVGSLLAYGVFTTARVIRHKSFDF